MKALLACGFLSFFTCASFGQNFAVASIKSIQHPAGKDDRGQIVIGPDRLSCRNVTLKDLLAEAWHLEPWQVSGPKWLDENEFDVDARSEGPTSKDQIRHMLQTLLTERFQLTLHRDTKEIRAYELVKNNRGFIAKVLPEGHRTFHGDMGQFARFLSIQLTIPAAVDPTRPVMASGPPIPVLDNTGMQGIYDIDVDFAHDLGTDMFTLWQRVLQDQLGLKLENRKIKAEFLVVDNAARVPQAN